MSDLLDAIRDGRVRVGDGAMGTMLQDAGLDDGGAPELWNVDRPEVIAGIFEQYVAAGSRLLTTNTFGGNRSRLAMHGLEDRVAELNIAAAQLARSVADRTPGVYVLGDIGPSGDLMDPMGDLTPETAQALFAEQIIALAEGGADAILIETMSDLSEVEAAVVAAQSVAPGLPIITTMSFDTNLRTMMGVTPPTRWSPSPAWERTWLERIADAAPTRCESSPWRWLRIARRARCSSCSRTPASQCSSVASSSTPALLTTWHCSRATCASLGSMSSGPAAVPHRPTWPRSARRSRTSS